MAEDRTCGGSAAGITGISAVTFKVARSCCKRYTFEAHRSVGPDSWSSFGPSFSRVPRSVARRERRFVSTKPTFVFSRVAADEEHEHGTARCRGR